MNNTFSMARFANLFRKHTAEQLKYYVLATGVLAGILFTFIAFHELTGKRPLIEIEQYDIYVFGLFLTCALFTSSIFTDLGKPRSAIATLTLPASHLEKFLVKWLYSGPIFLAVFTGLFYLLMPPLQNLYASADHPAHVLNIFKHEDVYNVFIFYAAIHAVTLLGAISFRKMHFVKTGFVTMVVITIIATANVWLVQAMLGTTVDDAFPFGYTGFREHGQYYHIYSEGNENLLFIAALAVACILWVASYFRLKEKQV